MYFCIAENPLQKYIIYDKMDYSKGYGYMHTP